MTDTPSDHAPRALTQKDEMLAFFLAFFEKWEASILHLTDMEALDRARVKVASLSSPEPAPRMPWQRADTAEIDPESFYLVQDNGGEWRDFDLSIMRGRMVIHKMEPSYIRGRPEWIAKIDRPSPCPKCGRETCGCTFSSTERETL